MSDRNEIFNHFLSFLNKNLRAFIIGLFLLLEISLTRRVGSLVQWFFVSTFRFVFHCRLLKMAIVFVDSGFRLVAICVCVRFSFLFVFFLSLFLATS